MFVNFGVESWTTCDMQCGEFAMKLSQEIDDNVCGLLRKITEQTFSLQMKRTTLTKGFPELMIETNLLSFEKVDNFGCVRLTSLHFDYSLTFQGLLFSERFQPTNSSLN